MENNKIDLKKIIISNENVLLDFLLLGVLLVFS